MSRKDINSAEASRRLLLAQRAVYAAAKRVRDTNAAARAAEAARDDAAHKLTAARAEFETACLREAGLS